MTHESPLKTHATGIDSALAWCNPRLYRGFTITNERDGYYRIYSGGTQRGYAQSRSKAEALVDKFLGKPDDAQPSDTVERVARAIEGPLKKSFPSGVSSRDRLGLQAEITGVGFLRIDTYALAHAALEASHHAELVEALKKLANENSSFVVGPSARRYIRAVIAKISGDA